MALWLVRAGKHGEDENTAIDKGLAIIGWVEMPDVSNIQSYEDMKQRHSEIYPDMSPKAIMNNAAQLWAFTKRIKKDDFVVLPLKTSPSFLVSDKPNKISFKNQYVKVPKAYAPNRAKLVDFAILLLLKRH